MNSPLLVFSTEHNIPFSTSDHFETICQKAFPDSKIVRDISLKLTKMSCVIQDGIAFHERLSLTTVCQTQKFSLIIDESTDISVTQILAVVDELLDTVTVERGTAQSLYEATKFF